MSKMTPEEMQNYITDCIEGRVALKDMEADVLGRMIETKNMIQQNQQQAQKLKFDFELVHQEGNKLAGQLNALVSLLVSEEQKRRSHGGEQI